MKRTILGAIAIVVLVFVLTYSAGGRTPRTREESYRELNEVLQDLYFQGYIQGWQERERKCHEDQREFERKHS